MIFREWLPDAFFARSQVLLEPRYELDMLPLCRSALCICSLARHSEALGGPSFAVPLKRVTAREIIPTILTKVYGERVRLRALTVMLESAPFVELGVGTETAPDLANRPACPVDLRRHK